MPRSSLLRRAAVVLGAAVLVAAGVSPASAAAVRVASSTAPSCGKTILRAGSTPWTCTFSDDFDGTSLDRSKWIAQETATSGYLSGRTACFVNTPANIAVAGGVLSLTARKEATPFTCVDPVNGNFTTQYTSGMVSTWGKFSQAYGRFEIRARVPATSIPGLHSAFWLWPQAPLRYGPWPGSGEIDIAEIYSRWADRAIPYVHYVASALDPNVTNTSCLVANVGTFHTYAVEWTPSSIKIVYDGRTCLTDSWIPGASLIKPQPFDQPFIVALTQALGVGTNAFDPTRTPLPATTQVDYVRVWK